MAAPPPYHPNQPQPAYYPYPAYYPPPPPQQQQQQQQSVVVVNTAAAAAPQTIVIRRGVNHALHCIISFFFWPWVIVWIILCIQDGHY